MLLAVAVSAQAETWFETPNKNGGKIVLTDSPCTKYPTLRFAMSTSPNGKTLFGCWTVIAGDVQLSYNDGEVYSYPMEVFNYVNTDKK